MQGDKSPYKLAPMSELGKRIKEARKHAALTQKELAERVGISQPVISQLEKGENLQSVHLIKVAEACGVDPVWLATGRGFMAFHPLSGLSNEIFEARKEASANPLPSPGDEVSETLYAYIPQHTAKAAAGDGHENPHVEIRGTLSFKRSWLAYKGLKERNLEVIYADGESMWPTITTGDVLLLDTSRNEPGDGQVFALNSPTNGTVVKRLRKQGRKWVLVSDNPDKEGYPDRSLEEDCGNEMSILGRVVWRGGDL